MKTLNIQKYKTKERNGVSDERWGISSTYPELESCFDDHLASFDPKLLEKAGIDESPEGLEKLGTAAQQAIAIIVNTELTSKISKANMADWSEDQVREYAAKNFIKIAAESKSTKQKTDEKVAEENDWFQAKTAKMAELYQAGKTSEANAIHEEIKARKRPTV